METPLLKLRAAALASVLACAGIGPVAAAPAFIPYAPTMQSDVVQVDSATIIRRDRRHRDRDGNMRRHRRESREHARRHDDGFSSYRPKATRKHAYDADGNYRIYDGDGWKDKGRRRNWDRQRNWHRWNDWNHGDDWDGWDARDGWDGRDAWDHKKGPRLYKHRNFSFQEPAPSPALKDILTAVPD